MEALKHGIGLLNVFTSFLQGPHTNCSDRNVVKQRHLPEHTVGAAIHADRMMVFLFLLFFTLLLTNTDQLGLFKVFLGMSVDISK